MAETPGTISIGEPEKRFGLVAIEKGYITPDDLIEALRIQVQDDIGQGKHQRIGEILVTKGKMTDAQVEDVLETLSHQ